MTPNEQQAIIWACLALLSVIAFIGAIFIKYFMGMAKDVSAIKTQMAVNAANHEYLERRVSYLEEQYLKFRTK